MKKKNYRVATLVLAGVIGVSGTGILAVKMSSAESQEVVTTVEKTLEPVEVVEKDYFVEEPLKAEEEQVSTKKEETCKIKLPEGAVLEKEEAGEYKIAWKDYHITYYKGNTSSGFLDEKEEDMGIELAITATEKYIQNYSYIRELIDGADICIYLEKFGSEVEKSHVDNTKNYGVRCYGIHVSGKGEHSYFLYLNSITGEIICYDDFYMVEETREERIQNKVIFDGYMETELGYGAGKGASSKEIHDFYDKEIEAAKDMYIPIAKDFIEENFNLGKVTKCFGFLPGEMVIAGGSRLTMDFCCQTETGDVVEMSIDQVNKTVQGFWINPLDYN